MTLVSLFTEASKLAAPLLYTPGYTLEIQCISYHECNSLITILSSLIFLPHALLHLIRLQSTPTQKSQTHFSVFNPDWII